MSVKETPPTSTSDITCAPIPVEDFEFDRNGIGSTRQWTIKGIKNQTVGVSREAAKRSGMKLNAWISQALESAANEPRDDSMGEDAANHTTSHDGGDVVQHLKRELDRLRADNEDMKKTVKLMNDILLKLVHDRI